MNVSTSSFTVAQYCAEFDNNTIVVNTDYQRSSEVWPQAARSYLMDTILLGFPIPKITLYQKTDLRSRQTIKEIVDGQQRTNAIHSFLNDGFRITGKSQFKGLRYSDLEEPDQQRFVEYQLTADILLGATEDQIRQLFRRINSYTVPLNYEEQRHATHQGDFKWFMVDLTEKYSQSLKEMGVLKERQLSRMQDAKLFTEIILAMENGIETYSKAKLDSIYSDNDTSFGNARDIQKRFDIVFTNLLGWQELHDTSLMKYEPFYSLTLAISHVVSPLDVLNSAYKVKSKGIKNEQGALRRLSELAAAIDDSTSKVAKKYSAFQKAADEATNTKTNRTTRFKGFCEALRGK